jgi:transposase-like protein
MKISDEVRIGAVADYLLGLPYETIRQKWGVTQGSLGHWLHKVGCFKWRKPRRKKSK